MEIFLMYLRVFVTGGLFCLLGQILINKTKMTSARILVFFLSIGVILEATGAWIYVEGFGGSGATIPIVGFGANLARGAIHGAKIGILPALTMGLESVAGGLTAVIIFGLIFGLIVKSRTKKM